MRRIYSYPLECELDRGLGACVLRGDTVRAKLIEILTRFDGSRYQLGDYVVMPNHVHLLMRVPLGAKMRTQCHRWKSFSARVINEVLGRTGRLWQSEPFDHVVRSPAKLEQCRAYIQRNPMNARLRANEYTLGRGKGYGVMAEEVECAGGEVPVRTGS